MSRGLGVNQRHILDELLALPPGAGVLVGDGGSNMRRAAHSLAARELVSLDQLFAHTKRRLVARLR